MRQLISLLILLTVAVSCAQKSPTAPRAQARPPYWSDTLFVENHSGHDATVIVEGKSYPFFVGEVRAIRAPSTSACTLVNPTTTQHLAFVQGERGNPDRIVIVDMK
jgi:hypothetical protein